MKSLHCSDNLEIMQEMESGSIDLIATDPPFNTNRDWGAFDDRWEGGLTGYLKFMLPRLKEMHRLLKSTGSLYLQCDSHASHYLKVMLDEIFGIECFKADIIWKRTSGRSSVGRLFPRIHDNILYYTKSDNYTFNPVRIPLSQAMTRRYNKSEDGRKYYITSKSNRRGPACKKIYLDESKGVALTNLWDDIFLSSNSKERTGYPTQKPVALYERMIKASSNEGDVVLDPFCGSGATLDAAQRLGRHYIGIDQNRQAIELCEKRLNPSQQELL